MYTKKRNRIRVKGIRSVGSPSTRRTHGWGNTNREGSPAVRSVGSSLAVTQTNSLLWPEDAMRKTERESHHVIDDFWAASQQQNLITASHRWHEDKLSLSLAFFTLVQVHLCINTSWSKTSQLTSKYRREDLPQKWSRRQMKCVPTHTATSVRIIIDRTSTYRRTL
jgi:hypothetical protein